MRLISLNDDRICKLGYVFKLKKLQLQTDIVGLFLPSKTCPQHVLIFGTIDELSVKGLNLLNAFMHAAV
jgi:hypothetical protein